MRSRAMYTRARVFPTTRVCLLCGPEPSRARSRDHRSRRTMIKRTVEPIRIVRALWRIAVLCLIASGIAVAGAASFGIAWNASTSPLSIERVYSYLSQSPGTPVVFIKDCMAVKNSGKVAATSIRGLFGLVNDVGASTAKPVLEIVDESLAPSSDATYCSNWGYSGERGHYVGFLTSARFADGSAWFI